jgi:membrane-bound lytic murein transglycosylase D
MKMKSGYAAFACLFLLGACAHAPPPADPITYERITRTMREVESRETTEASGVAEKSSVKSEVVDATMPAGIDLTKFELPMQYNERVQEYVDLYSTRRRTTFATWLRRMGRYRSMIEDRLDAHGLPRELVYLPLIESMYDANAASGASAVGLWQFMAGTARSEGLQVDEYVDERRDPIRSTDAAIRHLSGLYNHFGSWYLTAAAYNSGSTRIGRLLKQHGYSKGRDDAFWAMQDALPKETRDYVPMLLAAVLIGENAASFGITAAPEKAIKFETVMVPGSTDLRAVARAAGISYDELKALNYHYIKGMTPPDSRSEVRVPVGAAEGFADAFDKIPKSERSRALGKSHVVKSGETLSHIARKYGTTVEAITRVNRIVRPDAVAAGRKLVIPPGDDHGD